MPDALTGIDIGNGSLKFALYRGDADIRVASCRLPENMMSSDKVVAPQTMAAFMKKMSGENNMNCKDAALVLPATSTYYIQTTLPAMTIEELELNLPYEFRDFITEEPDSYFYDYQVDKTEVDDNGKPVSISLYAAAVLKSTIEEYSEILRRAGFKLRLALPHEAVYSHILSHHVANVPEDAGRVVAFVDIGYDVTTISIFKGDNYIASKTVDLGCLHIDRAIAGVKNIDEYTASAYKVNNFEGVLDLPECVDIYNNFAIEVNKMVNFFNYNYPESELTEFYYLGGGSNIKQLTAAIDEFTQMPSKPVTMLLPDGASALENVTSCVMALGISLSGRG